jgi:hypothetical protein
VNQCRILLKCMVDDVLMAKEALAAKLLLKLLRENYNKTINRHRRGGFNSNL